MEFDELSRRIIGCALEVHSGIGPGLLESAYEKCLAHELRLAGIPILCQVPLAAKYKGLSLDYSYRADIIADNRVIVELKAVDKILPIHEAQLLTYMRLSGMSIGLLLNFNVERLSEGIRRKVLSDHR